MASDRSAISGNGSSVDPLVEQLDATCRAVAMAERDHQGPANYLARREAQIQYAAFARAGYCIGSGIVESANKHVVQARLRGAGMQWVPASVNAILALRCGERSRRWSLTWSTVARRLQHPQPSQPPRRRHQTRLPPRLASHRNTLPTSMVASLPKPTPSTAFQPAAAQNYDAHPLPTFGMHP